MEKQADRLMDNGLLVLVVKKAITAGLSTKRHDVVEGGVKKATKPEKIRPGQHTEQTSLK